METSIPTRRFEPITGPHVWSSADLRDSDDWRFTLDDRQVDALLRAMRSAMASGRPVEAMRRGDFAVPELQTLLTHVARALESGRGFVMVRACVSTA